MAKKLWFGSYLSFYDDGTFGHDDGAGYVGRSEEDEVRDLYEVLKKFFAQKDAHTKEGLKDE